MSRELHIVTERPNTEPKPTPSELKTGQTKVRRKRRSEGGRDEGGERERHTETERGSVREILTVEEKNFFFRPARERGWPKGGREGEREGDEGTGGERERAREREGDKF